VLLTVDQAESRDWHAESGRLRGIPSTEEDLYFLCQVANQIAIAVENALDWELTEAKERLAEQKLYLEDEPPR